MKIQQNIANSLKDQGLHRVSTANYVTMINPGLHPDRIMQEHDLLYMIDGRWEILQDGRAYEMHSDDLLVLPAGHHHYGVHPCTPHNRHMYIHVTPIASDCICDFQTQIHCQGNPRIKQLYEEIISTYWSDTLHKEDKLSYLLALLLIEVQEQQTKKQIVAAGKNVAEEAIRIIQSTPQTFYTNKELAGRFFVCERTLSNQFHKFYGKSVYTYQMDLKLEMVCLFLKNNPQVKLREAALNFGFCDEFHLSKVFKKKYGISPSEYRKEDTTDVSFFD